MKTITRIKEVIKAWLEKTNMTIVVRCYCVIMGLIISVELISIIEIYSLPTPDLETIRAVTLLILGQVFLTFLWGYRLIEKPKEKFSPSEKGLELFAMLFVILWAGSPVFPIIDYGIAVHQEKKAAEIRIEKSKKTERWVRQLRENTQKCYKEAELKPNGRPELCPDALEQGGYPGPVDYTKEEYDAQVARMHKLALKQLAEQGPPKKMTLKEFKALIADINKPVHANKGKSSDVYHSTCPGPGCIDPFSTESPLKKINKDIGNQQHDREKKHVGIK